MAFEVPTTLVLGAGASCGYDYPLGHDLIDQIIGVCSSWRQNSYGALAYAAERLEGLLTFYDPVSIDVFLTHYSNDDALVHCAKMAILHVLIQQCHASKFTRQYVPRDREPFHWYRFLWDALVSGRKAEELAHPDFDLNLKIITFNYDPSLDWYLYSRVTSSGSMFDASQQTVFLEKLKDTIHHVYGCILDYEWQGGNIGNASFDVQDFNPKIVASKKYENIFLIDEREREYDHIQQFINAAEQVIFLGFGFDNTNIGEKVLHLSHCLATKERGSGIVGPPIIKYTNYGGSEKINRKLVSLLRGKVPYPRTAEEFLFKSTKTVYRALCEDFSLNTI